MKGGVSSYSLPSKRGWRGLAVAVFGLVILSMLVPLVFLLGLHNGFHSTGYVSDDRRSAPNGLKNYDLVDQNGPINQSEDEKSTHIDDLMKRLGPTLSKDVIKSLGEEAVNNTVSTDSMQGTAESRNDTSLVQKGLPEPPPEKKDKKVNVTKVKGQVTEYVKGATVDETGKSCQLEFGSYCLWREEHKEEMKDSIVKKMKDQLFVARAYFPSIAKLPTHDKLSRELRQNIQEFERILSESTTDTDLPPHIGKKLQKMEATIGKAKSFPVDCNNVDKKLRQILDLTEDEAHFHMKQSAFLYQLAVQTMPKSHHCLSMRLTVEYFKSQSLDMELPSDKYVNPALHHYVIFSNNILASSVVINSTVMHAKESAKQVFHVLTDGQNYYAMKLWFFRNSYKEATIHVMKIEDLNLDNSDVANSVHLSLSNEFRVSFRSVDKPQTTQMSTEYISVFGDTHFLLPELFPDLKKVVVLDDDIVVKQDLSPLWSLDMEGKVNGAVNFCSVRLGQLKNYLVEDGYNQGSCTWMSGLNVVDLVKWKERNLTQTYHRLLQKQRTGETSARVEALPANLLTFQDLIYPLDDSWVLSGLGHNYGIDAQAIKKAAVLHYNGNMKPWLELGIPKYKAYWKMFLLRNDLFMSECNVNP
ncbi:Glycosyl transferase [Macleaya cordata]|uniref:Hexosyltransferase n=1 Tax=Macleaya cordata TaxID=56857 RepID=A0A200R353_MACCD|nr:Glycosyl transferase [Macleaya cordata]